MMRLLDVLLAFPMIVFALLIVSAVGPEAVAHRVGGRQSVTRRASPAWRAAPLWRS